MNETALRERLRQAGGSADPISELVQLVEELEKSNAGVSAVRPILMFMEENPTIDLGAPGPLVHFVERFYRSGYEAELLVSLTRRPTPLRCGCSIAWSTARRTWANDRG